MSDKENPNPEADTETDIASEAVEAEPEATEVAETDSEVIEDDADQTDADAEASVEVDYLAPVILDEITTVTPEQLKAMEESEVIERDTSLEEIVRSSVGNIMEDEVINGRVIGMNDREVLVDIGFKSEGVVPREEFSSEEIPQIGDEIYVYLVRMEDANGQTVLSKEKADFMQRWAEIRQKAQTGENITGRISRRIKGGMVVDLDGVPAFLPGSQIDIRPVQDFDEFIGQEFEFKIVKINEARKNIVLSRKELMEADLQERKDSLIADLHVGQVLEGRVKNITDFGVFVDLGGLDGLLHITDLSWGRVIHPSEIVEMDELITIKVIDFDPEKQRVSLGLKQLQPHPWESVEAKYPVGSVIEGKVVSMTNYGAFVEIEKGVEGLVHVSEMSWIKHVRHPSEMFSLGENIEAKILNVDVNERKISLGVKQLQPDPWDQIEEKYKVGTIQKGLVRNLTQFGAFVELEEGIDGLIHITDLSWTRNVRHPREILSKGDELDVRVLDVSRENRRIALGLKQVVDDPWDQIETYFPSGKQVKGDVIRVLDKGVILQMEMDIEGIIPLRDIPKRDRRKATEHLKPGDTMEVTVQELSIADKKVILISDVLAARPEDAEEAPADIPEVEKKAAPKKKKAEAKAEEAAAAEAVEVEEAPADKPKVEKKAAPKKKKAEAKAEEAAAAEAVEVEEAPADKPKVEKKAAPKKKKAETKTDEAAAAEVAKVEEAPKDKAETKKKAAAAATESATKGSKKKTAVKAKKETKAKSSKSSDKKAAKSSDKKTTGKTE
ncbi:MAG: 30S ribosomal protein S1 [Fidelibacterota bacterium]|nr:MAG: 30S ribosomal protein S1 [Candidatus Neomarinimicrobiota bacterium]